MNCPNCNAPNEQGNVYCITCGASMVPGGGAGPTVSGGHQYGGHAGQDSVETRVFGAEQQPGYQPGAHNFRPPSSGAQPIKASNMPLFVALGVLAALLLGGGAYIILSKKGPTEKLPDHLGLFALSSDKQNLNQVMKYDVTSALQAKTDLLKNETLPSLEESPSLIFYSDGKGESVTDLRLIQLDTIKDDGTIQQLDFQTAPIEGKPDIKRLRVPTPLANGKYAFALLDGFLDEGKHKFWAFQIKNSSKSSNGDALKTTTVSLKPKPPAPPKPGPQPGQIFQQYAPPVVGNTAVSTTGALVLRAEPSQYSTKLRNLGNGERVEVLGYSSNSETFKGRTARFAQVRTGDGTIGWAFSAFLR